MNAARALLAVAALPALAAAHGTSALAGNPPARAGARTEIPMYVGGGDGVSKAIAGAFVRPMLRVPDGKPTPPFEWGKYDVMGTGYGEIFLAFKSPGQCSEAGCPLLVMRRRKDGSWDPILTAVATSVAAVRDGAVADLLVRGAPGESTTWGWDAAKGVMVARRASAAR